MKNQVRTQWEHSKNAIRNRPLLKRQKHRCFHHFYKVLERSKKLVVKRECVIQALEPEDELICLSWWGLLEFKLPIFTSASFPMLHTVSVSDRQKTDKVIPKKMAATKSKSGKISKTLGACDVSVVCATLRRTFSPSLVTDYHHQNFKYDTI